MLALADLMFLLTTAHISLLLYETFTGTTPPRVLQCAVAVAQIELALGDLILVWRVWVVWNHNIRVVVLPFLALLASFVVGMAYAIEAVSYNALSKILPAPAVILSVINTSLCTALIAGRLAYLDHLFNGHLAFGEGRDHNYRGAILMIIESGAILTMAHGISLTLERLRHPGLHVMLNILVPLSNIVPTTIVVLSHLKYTLGDTANETATVRFATRVEESAAFGNGRERSSSRGARGHEVITTARSQSCGSLDFPGDVEKQYASVPVSLLTVPGQ
ncbi:hypothetical protein C8Q80DRAFT_1139038 [Daedaleopsis nitida]|nr:hypothetical protein C8Q80DRAFT_1139038 [Daedaleopsis nitida]